MQDKKVKLSVGPGGQLNQTTTVEPSTEEFVTTIPFVPEANTLLVRQLPSTEMRTASGVILPPTQEEHRGVIVCVGENITAYKPGDIVVINLAHGNIFQHYICGQLLAPLYQSTILGKYTNYALPVVDGTGV